jgi:hypothetical protein
MYSYYNYSVCEKGERSTRSPYAEQNALLSH